MVSSCAGSSCRPVYSVGANWPAATRTVYSDGVSEPTMYPPSGPDVVGRSAPVFSLRTTTVAPDTDPPLVSRTVPVIRASP